MKNEGIRQTPLKKSLDLPTFDESYGE